MKHTLYTAVVLATLASSAWAQDPQDGAGKGLTLSGSIQSDILIPQADEAIGAEKSNDWALTNTYAEVNAMSKYVDAGARFEFLKHPLTGFTGTGFDGFRGWGVPYYYVKGHVKNAELTVGNYYEQFGSGFILRTYEERSLGVDNSLLGARLVVKPADGVTLKALTGKQRRFWHHNDALISGADVELNLDRWIGGLASHGTYLTLGASWVNKHDEDELIKTDATHRLNLPENVNAFDLRANLQTGNFGLLGEYAWKTDDPVDAGTRRYIYRTGRVAMLSATYSKPGMSLLLQAKRSDNMAMRSRRTGLVGSHSYINHMPAFTMEHTYTLAALYPYATQDDGEWAYQAELGYKFKRHTFLGGKYGTDVKVNFSHVHAIDVNPHGAQGTDGYGSAFWKWGDQTYYQDINVQVGKKITKDFTLNLIYMNQFYNAAVIKKEDGMYHSDIFVAEGKYRFNKKLTLRGELQYLATDDDQGDWTFGLLELSFLPHFMFTVSDLYNNGETHTHYYQGYVTYNTGAHRIQLGYGRTRAGFNCSGGVCRWIPATKGVTLSYNYNF